jgi:hypothetical protein
MPPSTSFGAEPELTAVPHDASARWGGADDYEAISPEGLSSAFLSRATDSWLEPEDGQNGFEAELQGFQIATIEDLTLPELSDDPADFEIPDPYRRIKSAR